MNKNYEMKKNNAASVLTDEIVDVFEKLNKATGLMQEVTIEYFHRYDRVNKEDHEAIVWEFNRAALYASVVEDYVFEAKQAVLDLVARSQNSIQEDAEEDEDIEKKRRFLREKFPEMADRTSKVSDEVIAIAYDMIQLDDEELKEFGQHLEDRVK